MSLEASLIMPMVICVMALLVYFSYFLYGRCILSQDTYILAFGAALSREDKAPSVYVENNREAVTGRKYFGSKPLHFKTEVSGKEILVSAEGETRHGAMGNYFLKPRGSWEYRAQGMAKIRRYSEHIRKLTRFKDIGKEIFDIGE